MNNGIIGTHLATNQPVELELTTEEMSLATSTLNKYMDWDTMCELVLERTGITLIGQVEIDFLIVNGNKRVFH
tara:strand:- start:621 stop:839 length:219 start_codon:yes stop_codon:yes gene_type:complete